MTDIYQAITDKIIAQLEAGASKWRMPWHSRTGAAELALPRNVAGRVYRGVNVPLLWGAAIDRGYESPVWATYKQWAERGAQVRKGEKSAMIVFWKSVEHETTNDAGEKVLGHHMIAKAYFVFNAAQVDGFDADKVSAPKDSAEDLSEDERIASADAFFAATGSIVRHGGNRAFYTTGSDFIQMPQFGQFHDAMSYYSTLGHEHVHWTGAKARLDRQFGARFGDEAYAFEELIAELGAAYLCGTLGLSNEPREDHAAYLQSWLRVLKGDKKAIFTAASKAQAAVDYLQSLQDAPATRLAA